MVKTIESDIFLAPVDIIIHQANCFHTMGSGIARSIREKFPEAYQADCLTPDGYEGKLGEFSIAKVREPKTQVKYIINLYSQFRYGTEQRQTNYEAFYSGMETIKNRLALSQKKLTVGIPYKIGCMLGGGNWNIVEKMIQEIWADYPGQVLVCKFEPK